VSTRTSCSFERFARSNQGTIYDNPPRTTLEMVRKTQAAMFTFGTPNELALVAFLIGVVIIHSVVPKVGEMIGRLFEREKRKTDS
jgi:hypothetical protein